MAAVAMPPVDGSYRQLTDLRNLYTHKMHHSRVHPYFAVALVVASAAMLIFGSLPVAAFGVGTLFISFAIANRKLSMEEERRNVDCQEVLDKLAVPGFFEYARRDARNFRSSTHIDIAFRDFVREARPL